MKNDILSEYLGDEDFLQFAIEYNDLNIDKDDLGITLSHLQHDPNNRDARKFVFVIPEFTDMLLQTLQNYRSHDMLDRVLQTFSTHQVVHLLGNEINIYHTPSDFTAIFYGNNPHGLQSLSVLGQAMNSILTDWNARPVGTSLGLYYYINLQTGGLVVEAKIGSTKPHPSKEGYVNFFASSTLYTVTLDRNATFEYLNYKYPDKTLFEIFGVSFDVVMSMKYDE